MRRREFIALLGGAAIAAPLAAAARHRTGVPHIGVLWPFDAERVLEAFRQGLREFGYVEGENVVLDYRRSHGNDAVLPELAADLVKRDVDVILTWGVTAGRIAKQATATIPIVNGSMSDPVRARLVETLARPGGNLTGLTSASPVLSAKRLELLKEVVPGLSRVAALGTAASTASFGLGETEAAAPSLGVRLQAIVVGRPEELEEAFAAMARERAEALIVLPDLMFDQHRQPLVGLAATHRLPAAYYAREYVEAGGLLSYAASFAGQFRRAATYVDKILKGDKPGELPVEQPVTFELVLNIRTAKTLGLIVPPTLLARADEVIE
jgi:putative tryptophan/tyrosine transport system substrate-binding protein